MFWILFFPIFRFLRAHAINHAVLIDNSFIIQQRKKYIAAITKFRKEGRKIFYLDESYLNVNHSPARVLTDTTIKSAKDAADRGLSTGIPVKAGKGARLIIVGMGSTDGFVEDSNQIWKRTAKKGVISADYHSDIEAKGFTRWLKLCLVKLPPNSVVVRFNLIGFWSILCLFCSEFHPILVYCLSILVHFKTALFHF